MAKATGKFKEIDDSKLAELKVVASEILSSVRQELLDRQPFVGSISMNLNVVPVRDKRLGTACTDGNTVYFDIDFLSRLSNEERLFVLAHEVWHCVMTHFLRRECRDSKTWNYATDLEVNQLLAKDGMSVLKDALMPNRMPTPLPNDLSAEDYYIKLLENQTEDNSKGNNNKKSPCSGQFDKHFGEGDKLEDENDDIKTDKYGKVGYDEDFKPGQGKSFEQAADEIRKATVAGAQYERNVRGTIPGHHAEIVDEILNPEIDWREQLICQITSTMENKTNWNSPNRRFAYSGTYLPSHAGEQLRLVVGIDTSGSCNSSMQKFLSEVQGMVSQFDGYEIHLIQCDTEVKDYTVYDESNIFDLENTPVEVKGFGGTCLKPIFDYIKNNEIETDQIVIFTDGECETFSEDDAPDCPVSWIIDNKKGEFKNLAFGQKIFFKEN